MRAREFTLGGGEAIDLKVGQMLNSVYPLADLTVTSPNARVLVEVEDDDESVVIRLTYLPNPR